MKKLIFFLFVAFAASNIFAQEVPLVSNIYARQNMILNGKWNYVVDPLENGYYDYRLRPFDKNGFFENKKPSNPSELVEYNLDTSPTMYIPTDWNMHDNKSLFFYEGTIWFKRDFTVTKKPGIRNILYFGAVNYEAKVWVNGKKVGEHIGGYTPFNFDITDVVKDGDNFVVVKVDNKRHKDNVPTVNMDWWNYGGITREVILAEVPSTYIENYFIQLQKGKKEIIAGQVKLSSAVSTDITIEIPELKIKQQLTTDNTGVASFEFKAKPALWSPEAPKLYDVQISKGDEIVKDQIGFRTIETKDKTILLNGKPTFLRGISIHEEAPFRQGRAWSKEDARTLLTWAKELGCNYVRLAHYPHNENMVREAEKMGLMVWSEIPVYWTISWENPDTYKNAERQLHDMIARDKNRANIIIWSIANETPHSDARDKFLINLSKYARTQDTTRLISLAMEVTSARNGVNTLNDNLHEYVDVVSFNQYVGWYRDTPAAARTMTWNVPYNKPVIISEFGGGALQGLHGSKEQRFTEENQEEIYNANIVMFDKIEGLAGTSPWILVDFYSPRRQLFGIQDFFNRKGLISNWGVKKKAFQVMKDWYEKKEKEYSGK